MKKYLLLIFVSAIALGCSSSDPQFSAGEPKDSQPNSVQTETPATTTTGKTVSN